MGFNLKSPEELEPSNKISMSFIGLWPEKCNLILGDVCSLGHLLPEQASHSNTKHLLRMMASSSINSENVVLHFSALAASPGLTNFSFQFS
jgi:hypothetical protein